MSSPPISLHLHLRPREAAKALCISRATFYRYTLLDDFPLGRKLSRGVTVYAASELKEWVERQPVVKKARSS
jgi:predicted DNA-binding transcriptional regulator AlpA